MFSSGFIVLAFALFNRARGGLFPLGSTQLARFVYWALPNSLVIVYLLNEKNMDPRFALISFILVWVTLKGHDDWKDSYKLHDVSVMALIGILQAFAVVIPFALYDPIAYILALVGICNGTAYYIGNRILAGKLFSLRGMKIAQKGAEWGEILSGAGRGLLFILLTTLI